MPKEVGREEADDSASSTRTIPNDEVVPRTADEEKTKSAEDVEKSGVAKDLATAAEAVEGAPFNEVGEHPDGGLKAWLVVIGVSVAIHCIQLGSVAASLLTPS